MSFVVCAPHAENIPSAPLRSGGESTPALALADQRADIESMLASGDTLGAIERLQERAGAGWSDSLLDALVLPDDAPSPKRRPGVRSWHPALRFDFGRIPSKSSDDGFLSSSLQASLGRGFAAYGIDQWVAAGIRIHGLQADDETYAGLEPRLGWSLHGRGFDVTTDAWALAGPDLDADAGFGSDCRVLATPVAWFGGGFDLSLESSQEAALGAGFDLRSGAWSWSGQLNAGWIRMIAPSTFAPRAMEVDSLGINKRFPDGSLGVTGGWTAASQISQYALRDSIARSQYELESYDRNRLRLRARIALLRAWRGIRVGPVTELDIRSSLGEERWLEDARAHWTDTTAFLRVRGSSTTYAVAGTGDLLTARDAGPLVEAWYACARISPMLRSDWNSPERAWQVEAVVAWHLVTATDPGHPLEDDQQGLSARASLLRRW